MFTVMVSNPEGSLDFFLPVLLTHSFLSILMDVLSQLPVSHHHQTHTCQGRTGDCCLPEGREGQGCRLSVIEATENRVTAMASSLRPLPHRAARDPAQQSVPPYLILT